MNYLMVQNDREIFTNLPTNTTNESVYVLNLTFHSFLGISSDVI